MCLLIFCYGYKEHPFILCSNRDETFERDTLKGSYYKELKQYYPQDLIAGGTWITLSSKSNGRFAIILNFHTFRYDIFHYWKDPINPRSRGIIPRLFIDSNDDITATSFAYSILEQEDFQGYNLIIGDKNNCYYISNCIKSSPLELQPGVFHSISNGKINDEWPKMLNSKQRIQEILLNQKITNFEIARQLISQLLEVMKDSTPLPDATYNTTIPELMKLSAINVPPFIHNGNLYGTRTITIILALSIEENKQQILEGEVSKGEQKEQEEQEDTKLNLLIQEFNRLSPNLESEWELNEIIMKFTTYSKLI